MRLSVSEPGVVVSGAVHVTALALLLFAFSESRPLPDVHEAVPVETISTSDFQEVMRGEKDVKDIVDKAPPRAEKVAPTVETKPDSPKPVAQKDVSAPPPPAPPDPTPPEEPPPVPQPPIRPVAAEVPLPPDVPLPATPTPPPAPLPPQRVVADAEAIAPPTPPPKPQPAKPQPPKQVEQKPVPRPEPKPPVKPHPEKPKLDQVPKLLEQLPDQPARKAVAHARPAPEQTDQHQFDPTDISRLLSKEAPAQTASTGKQISHTKVAGSETGASQKMAASLWDQLDGLLEDQYKQCWSYLGLDGNSKYVPQIKVLFSEDGALIGEPVLINRPSDPSMQSLADSALRAVRRCNPLKIPSQYAPYYDQWRGRVLRFDPADMAG